jgi:hypothetical protein
MRQGGWSHKRRGANHAETLTPGHAKACVAFLAEYFEYASKTAAIASKKVKHLANFNQKLYLIFVYKNIA